LHPPCSSLFPYTTLFRSMGKSILLWVMALFLMSCSQDKKEEAKNDTSVVFHAEKLPKLLDISQNAMDILKDWPEYNALETSFKRSEEHTSELQSRENLVC